MQKAKLSKKDRKFVEWLESTLIPDLKESGREFTAEDIERAVAIIKKLSQ